VKRDQLGRRKTASLARMEEDGEFLRCKILFLRVAAVNGMFRGDGDDGTCMIKLGIPERFWKKLWALPIQSMTEKNIAKAEDELAKLSSAAEVLRCKPIVEIFLEDVDAVKVDDVYLKRCRCEEEGDEEAAATKSNKRSKKERISPHVAYQF